MRFFASLAWLALSCFNTSAQAYSINTNEHAQAIRWRYGQKLFLAGNSTRRESFPSESFRNAVVNALQQWKWATNGQFDFEYWQGTDSKTFENNQNQNGLSSIFFASNSALPQDPNVIGFTQTWYNNQSGDIVETDIVLNDVNFDLTDTASDSSVHGGHWNTNPRVFLNNLVTHELGHAIGLSHSGDLNSSMFYSEFNEQARISCDDWAGAHHLYPDSQIQTGSLTGVILSPKGERVAGASVTAISKSRGTPLASVLSDQNGVFHFGALEPGSVALMAQPFSGSPSSVPARVQTRSQSICENGSYPVQFLSTDGNTLKQFEIRPGVLSTVGSFPLQCESVQSSESKYNGEYAPEMLVDRGQLAVEKTYRFEAHGPFRISGTGYLLTSPIRVDLYITDTKGQRIPATQRSPLYQSASKFEIPDSRIEGSAIGPIVLHVVPSAVSFTNYPTPAIWPDETPFFVLSKSDTLPSLSDSTLPDNARCFPSTPFKAYLSPEGAPIRFASTQGARDGIGFCAPAARADGINGPTPQASPSSILGWLLPFGFILAFQLYSSRRRAKL